MHKHSVTIKDVAAAAGVAPMTVSNALHGKPGVSDSTRRKILTTAKRLDYRINASASMLKTGRSGIVHIVVNEFDSPFYSMLVEALSSAASERGLVPFPEETRYSPTAATRALRDPMPGQQLFDGEILHAQGIHADSRLLTITAGRPVVLIDACQREPVVDAVDLPNAAGGHASAQHLVERGCRSIAIVGIGSDPRNETNVHLDAHRIRIAAALDALAEHGLINDDSAVFDGRDEQTGVDAGHAIADSTIRFDGVWCTNDSSAMGVIRGLADRGLRVPQDVKVIGFDDVTAGSYTTPTLSTISPDIRQLSNIALDMLLRRIEHPDKHYTPTSVTVGYTLLARESTA